MTETKPQKNSDNKISERIYFPELDGLRFFAFILVFIHHNTLFANIPYLSVLKINGWIGVDLFFVLSAYLFTYLLIAESKKTNTINFRKFYIRRIFRIWPIYFLLVALSIFATLIVFHGKLSNDIMIRILGLFTFSDNILSSIYGYNKMSFSGHLWTIGYEEQFYIFIPFIIYTLVRASFKMRLISLLLLVVIFNAIRFYLIYQNVPYPAIYVLPFTHFESIILGIVVGFGGLDFCLKKINPLILAGTGILVFTLIEFLPARNVITYWQILTYLLVGISTALILYATLKSSYLKRKLSNKIFVFLGKRSYGLYIYHRLAIVIVTFTLKRLHVIPLNSLTMFIFSLIITILISIVSYQLIEIPFLVLKRKYEVITSRPI